MISEKTFIRRYSSFWEQLLPGIDNYVRMVNSGLRQRVYPPIQILDIGARRALINSIAFKIFNQFYEENIPISKLLALKLNSSEILEAHRKAFSEVSFLDNSNNFNEPPQAFEVEIIKELTKRLLGTYGPHSSLKVYPSFQGCGLLFSTSADIFYEDTLVEIKAGQNNFSKHDFFQLLTYLALNTISNKYYSISSFELFNIRTGLRWKEGVDVFCQAAAGASSTEITSEIVTYLISSSPSN